MSEKENNPAVSITSRFGGRFFILCYNKNMKYYPNRIFRLLILLNILAVISTILIAYFCIVISGLGMSARYTHEVEMGLLAPIIGIILFLIYSSIVLFLQQSKNYHFGYLMLVLVPFDIYFIYKIFSFFPIWNFISSFFGDPTKIIYGIFWSVVVLLVAAVALVPFYVLIKLAREDLKKTR
ncbi:MAG: hypothetical protein NTY61_03635 [Candidatus Parcubacteria bacterium]|nr:hypothetical protein [Candidatus Parcubacteria bacterium]